MSNFTRKIEAIIMRIFGFEFRRNFPKFSTKFIRDSGQKEIIAVEIGVLEGQNALSILKTLPIKRLYLIDPYIEDEEFDYRKQNCSLIFPSLAKTKERAIKKLNKYSDKIEWINKKSHDAINDIPNNLDFVYIDGNHEYWCVKQDMEDYWNKLKIGGVLSGHDITQPQITKAVCEFIVKHNTDIQIDFQDWVIVKK